MRKKKKSGKQTHVKHALFHTLLSIFPQVISVAVSVPSPSHAGILSQSDTFHVCSPKRSALQISTIEFPQYCSSFPLNTRVLNLSFYTDSVSLIITSPLISCCFPGISDKVFPVSFFYPRKNY